VAVKRKIIECECGETFTDVRTHLDGNIKYGPWQLKAHRMRETKAKSGGDILAAIWERTVECGGCGGELMREKRQYELTPPVDVTKPEPVGSYSSRELVVRSAPGTVEAVEEPKEGILRMKG
jgi:hypothetical protein